MVYYLGLFAFFVIGTPTQHVVLYITSHDEMEEILQVLWKSQDAVIYREPVQITLLSGILLGFPRMISYCYFYEEEVSLAHTHIHTNSTKTFNCFIVSNKNSFVNHFLLMLWCFIP